MLFNPLPYDGLREKVIATIFWVFGFVLIGLSYWIRTPRRRREREERQERQMRLAALKDEKGVKDENRPSVIFGSIYAIVNGLGIVEIIQDYVETINKNLATFHQEHYFFIRNRTNGDPPTIWLFHDTNPIFSWHSVIPIF